MNSRLTSLAFVRILAEKGHRIFSIHDVYPIATTLDLKKSYVSQLLRRCVHDGSIQPLYRGTYSLNQSFISGPPLSEYEIGNYIIKPSAIAFWSAFAIHQLTDQALRTILILAPKKEVQNSSQSIFEINGTNYRIIKVKNSYYFGVEKLFLTDIPIFVTDLERTLIDGLVRPDLCGGFRECMEAYRVGWDRVNLDKLITYGKKFGTSVLKRIGWLSENLQLPNSYLEGLRQLPCTSCYKLDVSQKAEGKISTRWNIRENL